MSQRVVRETVSLKEAKRLAAAAQVFGATSVTYLARGTWKDSTGELIFTGSGGCEVRNVGVSWADVSADGEWWRAQPAAGERPGVLHVVAEFSP